MKPPTTKPPPSRTRAWFLVVFSLFSVLVFAVVIPNFVKAGPSISAEAVGLSVVLFIICAVNFIRCPWRYAVAKGITFLLLLPGLCFAIGAMDRSRSPGSKKSACIHNLLQVGVAKAAWAQEEHKTTGDTPAARELFGKDRYILTEPKCPSGGIYTIGRVGVLPSCSVEGHTLE